MEILNVFKNSVYSHLLIPTSIKKVLSLEKMMRYRGNTEPCWCWSIDGEWHGTYPPVIPPGHEGKFGGTEKIERMGYKRHLEVFRNEETGEYSFGNKPNLLRGNPHEVERANKMFAFYNLGILEM